MLKALQKQQEAVIIDEPIIAEENKTEDIPNEIINNLTNINDSINILINIVNNLKKML